MITPAEIRQKALRVYPQVLSAAVHGNVQSLFPLQLRANLSPIARNIPATISAIDELRAKSKEQCGAGYSIHWKQIRSRDFGNNRFPERIVVDTLNDLLLLAEKQKHFTVSCAIAQRLQTEFPGLADWIGANLRQLAGLAEALDGLIQVVGFFLAHPWPDCYARQIPVAVDTKFVERHQALLREWLDELLPASAIQTDETKFTLRFGLRDDEQHTTVRILDSALQAELGLLYNEFSVPLRLLESLPVQGAIVIIVENRLNLLTLPLLKRAIALRGEGKAVTRLRRLKWLADNQILYWGDIDVEGLQILSSLRSFFPHVNSFLMNDTVLHDHPRLVREGRGSVSNSPKYLTPSELAAFRHCREHNARLEQEHLPQPYVDAAIANQSVSPSQTLVPARP